MTVKSISKVCSVAGCETQAKKRGCCERHYMRLRRNGTLTLKRRSTLEDYATSFWLKVAITPDPNKCWEWQRGLTTTGYGQVRYERHVMNAHRVAWILTHNEMPDGLILHSCDNRLCVNPRHLRVGTAQDNSDDRMLRNPESSSRRLKIEQVRQIRADRLNGATIKSLSDQYGVHMMTISFITNYRTWKGVV